MLMRWTQEVEGLPLPTEGMLEEELDPLGEKEKQFIEVVELMELLQSLVIFRWCGIGRKPKNRLSILKAFIAKAVYNFETTEMLIEYLKNSKDLTDERTNIKNSNKVSQIFDYITELVEIYSDMKTEMNSKNYLEERKKTTEEQVLITLESQQESYESLIRKLENDLRNHMKVLIK